MKNKAFYDFSEGGAFISDGEIPRKPRAIRGERIAVLGCFYFHALKTA
jgi:hypothetical protein